MHTLRTILVCLAFAAADMAMPAVPNALEVIDEVDESEYHARARGAHGRRMLRLPAPRSRDHVRIAPSPTGSRRVSPNRPGGTPFASQGAPCRVVRSAHQRSKTSPRPPVSLLPVTEPR